MQAVVEPTYLGKKALDSDFIITNRDFTSGKTPPATTQPKWKKIDAGIGTGLYEGISALIKVGVPQSLNNK